MQSAVLLKILIVARRKNFFARLNPTFFCAWQDKTQGSQRNNAKRLYAMASKTAAQLVPTTTIPAFFSQYRRLGPVFCTQQIERAPQPTITHTTIHIQDQSLHQHRKLFRSERDVERRVVGLNVVYCSQRALSPRVHTKLLSLPTNFYEIQYKPKLSLNHLAYTFEMIVYCTVRNINL